MSMSNCERLESRRLLSAGTPDPDFGMDGCIDLVLPARSSIVGVTSDYVYYSSELEDEKQLLRRPLNGTDSELLYRTTYTTPIGYSFFEEQFLDDGSILIRRIEGVHGLDTWQYERILPDGTIDPQFPAVGGYVQMDSSRRMHIQRRLDDGTLIVEMSQSDEFGTRVAILALNPDGKWEDFGGRATVSFGGDLKGLSYTDIHGREIPDAQLTRDAAGNWYVYGHTPGTGAGADYRWIIGRMLPDFELDTGFGDNGFIEGDIHGRDSQISDLRFDSDGRVIALISLHSPIYPVSHQLVRLAHDGSLDPLFQVSEYGPGEVSVVHIQRDNRIVLRQDRELRRLRSDGSLDEVYNPYELALAENIAGIAADDDVIVSSRHSSSSGIEASIRAIDSGMPLIAGSDQVRLSGADFNGDGSDDILLYNKTTGQVSVWLMQGDTRLGEVVLPTVANTDWQPMALADLNGDGHSDILWRNLTTGGNLYWQMPAGLTNAMASISLPPTRDLAWELRAATPFSSSNRADLFWQHRQTNKVYRWDNLGDGKFAAHLHASPQPNWQLRAAIDGDLIWQNLATGGVLVWQYGPGNSLTLRSMGGSPQWTLLSAGDLAGTGGIDLLWRNPATGGFLAWTTDQWQVNGMRVLPQW